MKNIVCETQYTTFGNVEIKKIGHFVTFSVFNTPYKNYLLLEVVAHDSWNTFFCPLKWMLLWKHLKLFNCVEFIINGACTTNVSQTLLLPNSDYCLELSIYENLYCIKFNLICIPLLFFCRWLFQEGQNILGKIDKH